MFFTNLPFYSTAIVKKIEKIIKSLFLKEIQKLQMTISTLIYHFLSIYIYIVSWRLTNLYLKGVDLNYFNECVIAVSCMKKIFEYKIIISKLLKFF